MFEDSLAAKTGGHSRTSGYGSRQQNIIKSASVSCDGNVKTSVAYIYRSPDENENISALAISMGAGRPNLVT